MSTEERLRNAVNALHGYEDTGLGGMVQDVLPIGELGYYDTSSYLPLTDLLPLLGVGPGSSCDRGPAERAETLALVRSLHAYRHCERTGEMHQDALPLGSLGFGRCSPYIDLDELLEAFGLEQDTNGLGV